MRSHQSDDSQTPGDQWAHRGSHLQGIGGRIGSRMVEKVKTYTARCQHSGDWWAISVPELKGVNTQARRLEKAEAMARDAIALFLDVPTDSFEVRVEPILPRELQKKVGRAKKVRGEAEELQAEAATVSAAVAADLVQGAHLTVRDAGRVLGLSHQRIAQLLKAPSGDKRRAVARPARPSRH